MYRGRPLDLVLIVLIKFQVTFLIELTFEFGRSFLKE